MIHRTFTRDELARALAAVGRPDLAEAIYSDRVPYDDVRRVGPRMLALDYATAGDVVLFGVVVARLLTPDLAEEFAVSAEFGLPGHPSGLTAAGGVRWPGWVLGEPTLEEWADKVNSCPDCRVDGRCPAHEHAPWDLSADADAVDGDRHLTAVPS